MQTNASTIRMTREEREFAEVSQHIDVEMFSLELEYSLSVAVREALDRRQAEFERLMEVHPKALAERERWAKNREESERRRTRRESESRPLPAQQAALQLARRWGARLVS